jgi:hypothetical protein
MYMYDQFEIEKHHKMEKPSLHRAILKRTFNLTLHWLYKPDYSPTLTQLHPLQLWYTGIVKLSIGSEIDSHKFFAENEELRVFRETIL